MITTHNEDAATQAQLIKAAADFLAVLEQEIRIARTEQGDTCGWAPMESWIFRLRSFPSQAKQWLDHRDAYRPILTTTKRGQVG